MRVENDGLVDRSQRHDVGQNFEQSQQESAAIDASAAKPGLTDAFIARCPSATSDCSNPAAWSAGGETRLSSSGSFDYTTAPNAGGLFLGDYSGLTSSAAAFDAFFAASQPIATTGRSDTFSSQAH